MKHGAYHYLNKPFDLDEVALLVEKALETTSLRREVRTLRANQAQPYSLDRIIGNSDSVVALRALLRKIAAGPGSTVLLTGESGTGKDLAAKVIHYNSNRASRPFMNITCSALPETLLESELFGHERGAFTGADRQKRGLLETADGGTVFLDEIGEMVPALQAKLLQVSRREDVSSASADRLTCTWMSEWSRRPIAISRRRSNKAVSGRTSTIASTSCRL